MGHLNLDNETPKHVVTLVHSRKPRKSKTNGPVSKSKVVFKIVLLIGIVTTIKFSILEELDQILFAAVGNFVIEHLKLTFLSTHLLHSSNLEASRLSLGYRLLTTSDVLLCVMGKSMKKPHKPKSEDTNQEKLYLLHMDLYGPMCVARVNGKKCILVIVNDFSRFTWVIKFRLKVKKRKLARFFIDQVSQDDPTSEYSSSGPVLYEMTPATISSGLMPNPPPSTPFVPPLRSDWDLLFQLLFDKLLTPPPSVDYTAPEVVALIHEVVAPVPAVSTDSPSSTNVDQDAPSPSNSQTTLETQPPIIPNDVEEDNHDIEVAHMSNDPYFGIPIPEVPSDQSSLSDSIHTIVHLDHQISEHNSKWTKDYPLENIIGELARPVSTRLQLHEQALFCYYDAFLTAVEPRTYKDDLTQSCWNLAMQEELNEFKLLRVWER
ncbi:retrovirus-related pol polyprotein from transposon TNT 1-94, partial [Tanacetum coccineum]